MRTFSSLVGLVSAALLLPLATAQTYTSCNPLKASCSPDSALGKTVNIDFTSGASDSFTAQGSPQYTKDGVSFSVAKSGDAPTLISKWYIMFGRVDVVMKAAPGTGIVSSFVMQSDDLDEIDWEWLGGDDTQVQSNYFGKGQTTTYNRGAFHPNAGNHDAFHTYTIIWTASQIVWQIDGVTVRALAPKDANGQYPQTPMQIKMGIWSGGDSSNAQGTIAWAGGLTDYTRGPYTMYVKSIKVQDYSTGTQYVYGDQTGTWGSIKAVGGSVNSGGSTTEVAAPAITSSSSGQPQVYPWVPLSSTLSTATVAATDLPGLPSGWTVSSSGKLIPPSSQATTTSLPASSTSAPSPSVSEQPSAATSAAAGFEVVTTYNQQGFQTVVTQPAGWATAAKSYDDQGFLITAAPAAPSATAVVAAAVPVGADTVQKGTTVAPTAANKSVQNGAGHLIGGLHLWVLSILAFSSVWVL